MRDVVRHKAVKADLENISKSEEMDLEKTKIRTYRSINEFSHGELGWTRRFEKRDGGKSLQSLTRGVGLLVEGRVGQNGGGRCLCGRHDGRMKVEVDTSIKSF